MEPLSAIAFEDDTLTHEQPNIDDTTTIPDALPSNNKKEAAISSKDTTNP